MVETLTDDMKWKMILDSIKHLDNGLANTMRLQNRTYEATKHLGSSLPLAVKYGEDTIKPFIFQTGGELLEKMSGRLLSATG